MKIRGLSTISCVMLTVGCSKSEKETATTPPETVAAKDATTDTTATSSTSTTSEAPALDSHAVIGASVKGKVILNISYTDATAAGIVLIRNSKEATVTLENGKTYAIADVFSDGSKIVSSNPESYYVDTDVKIGDSYYYSIYSYNSKNAYVLVGKTKVTVTNFGAAWMAGLKSDYANPVYGTLRQENEGNTPGARDFPSSIADSQGKLWLLGGYLRTKTNQRVDGSWYPNYGNDLWQLSTAGLWTWMAGSAIRNQGSSYGTKQVTSSANNIYWRENHMMWADKKNNIWAFGGGSWGAPLNDLWKFDGQDWTWMSGPSAAELTSVNTEGVGTKGVAAAENYPPSRMDGMTWTDAEGNLWLFGGMHYQCNVSLACTTDHHLINDLWKYDVTSNQWTLIGGDATQAQASKVTTAGTFAEEGVSYPGSRRAAATWTDSFGRLWLFGGQTFVGNYPPTSDYSDGTSLSNLAYYRQEGILLNDLWVFDPKLKQWAYVKGHTDFVKNLPGPDIYTVFKGTCGSTPVSDNIPGSRSQHRAQIDSKGVAWIFGGEGATCQEDNTKRYLNDLWAFFPAKDVTKSYFTWVAGGHLTNIDGKTTDADLVAGTSAASTGQFGSQYWPSGRNTGFGFWIDSQDQLWVYGGDANYTSSSTGRTNDVWKMVP